MSSNKMALDALTEALAAMEHMANVLNNMDAVDEEEDAQHDAAFEAVRAAIAELEKPQKSRVVGASMDVYPEADQRFFNFWYGHMFEDLMQPPLVGIDHATARYIWNAAAIAALQAEPQPEQERNAARLAFMQKQMLAADFDYGGECVLVFQWPRSAPVGADLIRNIDAARTATPPKD